ncbi:tetratricopeptide repeat protein, partial [Selenomonas sp.]|uniref:tetratricopeptide repeat protein n=1 Tax=Selenomonas sp. TaxID=2053611 RepID=UPI001CAB824D
MKKRKRNRAERTRKKRARREEKRQMKGTMTMAEKKIIMAEQIHAYVKKEKYAEAINAFADVLAQGEPPKECYADVARAYFELGDYKRAADWVSNALSVDPGNVDVRILLARICQRERRTDDALKLYENILAAHAAALTATQRAEIEQRAGLA